MKTTRTTTKSKVKTTQKQHSKAWSYALTIKKSDVIINDRSIFL